MVNQTHSMLSFGRGWSAVIWESSLCEHSFSILGKVAYANIAFRYFTLKTATSRARGLAARPRLTPGLRVCPPGVRLVGGFSTMWHT